jgi:hypothetical protein
MLKHTLIYRLALVAIFAISMIACKDDEETGPVLEPTISSVAPNEALPGTQVTISGTNLANATEVMFGTTEATIANNTASSIVTTVPANTPAGNQQITVTTAGGSATHAFTVLEETAGGGEEPEELTGVALTADDAYIISGFGRNVVLTANTQGDAARVVFFQGDNELGEATEAPFTMDFEVGDDVAAYTNFNIIARAFDAEDNVVESEAVMLRVGERFAIGGGELTGRIEFDPEHPEVERWNDNGPTEGAFPDDGRYPGFLNWDGDGDIEAASGVNLPVTVPEDGHYLVSLGMASGWEDDESFMRFYFNDDVDNVQRSPEVPNTGWVDFNDYLLDEPYELTADTHTAKVRFGGPYVHPYYVDLFKFDE